MDEDAPDQLVMQIVELLKPGETVLKVGVVSCMWVWLVAMTVQAMKRLGGSGGPSRQRWRKQKGAAADKETKEEEVTRII